MKVCVVGAGGREHALASVISRSADVVVTPGSAGILGAGNGRVQISSAPPEEIAADLVVIGPEAPLVEGLADRLRALGKRVVGPGFEGARLEGSKSFMKEMLATAKIPTASFQTFSDIEAANAFLGTLPGPWVIKTDGLAAGKGVLVAETIEAAKADVAEKLSGRAFGAAGRTVVIEEGLGGPEVTLLALCDGVRAVPLTPSRDFKRIAEGDAGANTGGMGAYSPLAELGSAEIDLLMELTVDPLLAALRRRDIEYRGVLYVGLMLTEDGPKVIEYNVRFGDPEAQVVLPRLADDAANLLMSVAEGRLGDTPRFVDDAAVCVVLAAAGYPGQVRSGDEIIGLAPDGQLAIPADGVTVFHAGTTRPDPDAPFVTSGGRVLALSAKGPSVAQARERAYEAARTIQWEGMVVRTDVARDAAMGVPL
jgi:phosphoribosylamine---glycine ligase